MNPHPITTGIEDFELMEEPYQFEFDHFSKNNIFLEYLYQGKLYPAGWAKTFGSGKLVYLTPGHTKDAFDQPMYQKLIVNSSRWVIQRGNYEKI
jgi:type 1 glutamine amidotransferase